MLQFNALGLSYMFLLIKKAKEKEISCKKENFKKHGKTVEYFSGVEQYFTNINAYANQNHKQ
jgi:hypothetical protein